MPHRDMADESLSRTLRTPCQCAGTMGTNPRARAQVPQLKKAPDWEAGSGQTQVRDLPEREKEPEREPSAPPPDGLDVVCMAVRHKRTTKHC